MFNRSCVKLEFLMRCIQKSILAFFLLTAVLAQVPQEGLVGEYLFTGDLNDETTFLNHANGYGVTLTSDRFGNEKQALFFTGDSQYVEIQNATQFSIAPTEELSISVWMKPSKVDFTDFEGSGYVHWMGKGESGEHEWVFRMYNKNSDRPNRISAYAFNLNGGLGSGSYVQKEINLENWIHIVARYNFPDNEIRLYRNGVLEDEDLFSDYNISPELGEAPLRLGTRDLKSFFAGSIDDLRIYNRLLSQDEITDLFEEVPQDQVRKIEADLSLDEKSESAGLFNLEGQRVDFNKSTVSFKTQPAGKYLFVLPNTNKSKVIQVLE